METQHNLRKGWDILHKRICNNCLPILSWSYLCRPPSWVILKAMLQLILIFAKYIKRGVIVIAAGIIGI